MTNCVANWPLILDYLRVLLTWPAVTGLCVLVAMMLFSDSIRRNARSLQALLGKFRWKLSGMGVTVEGSPLAESQQTAPTTPGLTGNANQADVDRLLRLLGHEHRMNLIFGSQYRFVWTMNSAGRSLTKEERDTFYREHVAYAEHLAAKPADIDRWTQWLVGAGLVRIDDGPVFTLLPTGQDFIAHVSSTYNPVPWRPA